MADNILDLKKVGKKGPVEENEKQHISSEAADFFLRWSGYEHEKISSNPKWFLWPGLAALFLIIFGIFAKSYFFIALVALAFVVLVMYASREPQKFEFAVTKKGVLINRQTYAFGDLKSFWVFDKPGLKELSLETSKVLHPFLHLPLGDVNIVELRETLRHFLPEKEHPISLIDQLIKKWGL